MSRKVQSAFLSLLFSVGVVGYPTWHMAHHPAVSMVPSDHAVECTDCHASAVLTGGEHAPGTAHTPSLRPASTPPQSVAHDAAHCWLCQLATMPLQAEGSAISAAAMAAVHEAPADPPPDPGAFPDASGVPYSCGPPA